MFQIRWLWKNLKGKRILYVFCLILTVVLTSTVFISPLISSRLIDTVIIGQKTEELVPLLLALVIFTISRSLLAYGMFMLYEICSQNFIKRLRSKLFDNMLHQDMQYFDKNRTGDLMTRLTGDLELIRHVMAYVFRAIVDCAFLFVVVVIYFMTVDWLFTLCLIAVSPLIFIVTKRFSKSVGPLYHTLREKSTALNTAAQENIEGNKIVRAFAQEAAENEKFDEKNKEYMDANNQAAFMWIKYFPMIQSLSQSLSVITLLVGGVFMIIGRITAGQMFAFSALTWALSNPMSTLGVLLNDLQRFFVSANKVIELFYARPLIMNRAGEKLVSEKIKGNITFENVSLLFSNHAVLKNLSFEIKAGETIAVMGETGSGKTLLVNMISRFYDASEGEVLIDGTPIKLWNLHALRAGIGMATQEVFLFSDTADGNIAYGNVDMPEQQVRQFANLACADFVNRLSEGYDTVIGERGVGLSGGQRQRIALARALAIRPSVLILDDTTSAVDMETEHEIQKNLNSLDFPCTKIIIAQRISSTKTADRIFIMKDGGIVQTGTHEQLIKIPGYYRDVYNIQTLGLLEEGDEV